MHQEIFFFSYDVTWDELGGIIQRTDRRSCWWRCGHSNDRDYFWHAKLQSCWVRRRWVLWWSWQGETSSDAQRHNRWEQWTYPIWSEGRSFQRERQHEWVERHSLHLLHELPQDSESTDQHGATTSSTTTLTWCRMRTSDTKRPSTSRAHTRFRINTTTLVRPRTSWNRTLVVPTNTSQNRRMRTRRWYRGLRNAWFNIVINWSKILTAWRHDLITIQAKSIEIQVVYLTKNRELDRHMFHSIWKKMNGLMPRVKAILDVYCEEGHEWRRDT